METEPEERQIVEQKCLKPTYEGWKHASSAASRPLSFRLKPTYEGWKPGPAPLHGIDGPGFEAYL